jgi:hypothetical protein
MTGRFVVFAVMGMLALNLPAQETRGEIFGRVTDASGAVVVGATVTATPAAGASSSALTNATGDYALALLTAGNYRLSIESPGFRPVREHNVAVRAGERSMVNVKLEVGGTRQTIQVMAHAPLLDAANPASGLLLDVDVARQLPIRGGDPHALSLLVPGVINLAENGTLRPYDNENVSAMAINGSGAGTHEYTINGASNTGGASGNVAFGPPPGTVSEFRITTSPFDARNGFSSGAIMSLGIRPGSRDVHAQLYSYLENPAVNANSFFSNASQHEDNFRENRWGAVASGPLYIPHIFKSRNRVFWMYGYDGIRDSQPYGSSNLAYTVPTASERIGDLGDLLAYGASYQIYDPATTRPATTTGRYTRDPFPNNLIPQTRLSKTAQNLVARYYPIPNLPGAKPAGVNYNVPSVQRNDFGSHLLRLDHAAKKNRLSLRANLNDRNQSLQRRFNDGAGTVGERDNLGFGADDSYSFRPTLLLNLRYNYTRYVDNWGPPSVGLDLTALGFSSTYVNQIVGVDPRNLMLPDITPTGYPELNGQSAIRLASDIHAFAADVTRVLRGHTFHIGGEHRIYRDATGNTGRSSGKLNFNTNWTRGPLDNAASSPIGQGLASFLLGLPTDGQMEVNPSLAQQYQVSGWYAQDNWKVSSRLSVTLGLRWEYEIPLTERYDRSVRAFDPSAALSIASTVAANYAKTPIAQIPAAAFAARGGLTFANVNGLPRSLWNSDTYNVAPRVAVAWLLNPKTVVRAGYGMAYDIARQSAIQTGFSRITTLVASTNNGQSYTDSLDNPFPTGFALPTGSSLGAMTGAGQAISAFPVRLRNPYAQRWEFTLQRSLGTQAIFQIAYVGNRGTHLRVTRQLDPIPAPYLSTSPVRDNVRYTSLTTNVTNPFYPLLPNTSLASSTVQLAQLLRPYPQFTSVTSSGNDGYSWYHALQASLQKRFSKNYMVTMAYTWSRYREAVTYLNESDPALYRSISNQDRPHRLVTSLIYDLPFARQRRGWSGALAKGWQFHGIHQQQSGAPLNFGNILYYGGDVSLPPRQRNNAHWFNTAVFERTSAAQLVDNIRTFPLRLSNVRSPGLGLLDVGMSKVSKIRERVTMELRGDAFNAFNHTHFGCPNTTPTSTDFGKLTTTAQLPRIVEFSVKFGF